MPTKRIPLFGSYMPRTTDVTPGTVDQSFVNCLFSKFEKPMGGGPGIKIYTRPTWRGQGTVSAVTDGKRCYFWVGKNTAGLNGLVTAWDATNSQLFLGTTKIGDMTGTCTGINETRVSDVAACVFTGSDSTAWYLMSDAGTGNQTFTGGTHTNTTIDNITTTAGMYIGQALSGTGITAGTRIATIVGATSITTTIATTATNAGITITRTALAKIIDSDYPGNAGKTIVGTFAALDGFLFIMTSDGLIYESLVNSISGWVAGEFISAQGSPDAGLGVIAFKKYVGAFGPSSFEVFQNSGNSTGSVLSPVGPAFSDIGATSSDAFCAFDGTVAWVTAGAKAQGVYIYDGQAKKISSRGVDLVIGNLFGTTGIMRFGIIEGRKLLFLKGTSGTGVTTTLVCDVDLMIWYWWQTMASAGNGDPAYAPDDITVSPYSSAGSGGITYAVTPTDSIIYAIAQSSATNIARENFTVLTEPIDFGTDNRKIEDWIRLVGDHKDTTTNTFTIETSDDDYTTFSATRSIDMTTSGANGTKLNRGGIFRRRAYRIKSVVGSGASTLNPQGLEAIEISYRVTDA